MQQCRTNPKNWMDIDQQHGWNRPLWAQERARIKMAASFSPEDISSSRQRPQLWHQLLSIWKSSTGQNTYCHWTSHEVTTLRCWQLRRWQGVSDREGQCPSSRVGWASWSISWRLMYKAGIITLAGRLALLRGRARKCRKKASPAFCKWLGGHSHLTTLVSTVGLLAQLCILLAVCPLTACTHLIACDHTSAVWWAAVIALKGWRRALSREMFSNILEQGMAS